MSICVVLISVTILFETVKHKLEHDVPPMMAGVLQAMFGELTVLGFIALYAYFMLRLGVLSWLSVLVYGDSEHLIHLFEDIHFMLFFVMILFLVEAVILVKASLKAESHWMRVEALISEYRREGDSQASFAPLVAQLLVTYKAGKADERPRLLWSYREAEAREELRYALIRDRFITPAGGPVAQASLPPDFEFSGYLRREMSRTVASTLHVTTATWLVVIAYLFVIIECPIALMKFGQIGVNVSHVIGLGWGLWLLCYLFQAKLDSIVELLTPRHPLLKGPPHSMDEEAPTQRLLQHADGAPFEELRPLEHCSKHEQLFWRGRDGPKFLLFLMRILMLLSAVSIALIWTWLTTKPEDTYLLLLGILPVLDVVISAPQYYLPAAVLASSVEQLKKAASIQETIQEMKTEKSLKMLKMLQTLSSQARRAQKLNASELKRPRGAAKPRELDADQEAELLEAFNLFDKDSSGYIDRDELSELMQTLGATLNETELNNMYTEMDLLGDGKIEFKEFAQAMAQDPNEQLSTVEMATVIFSMLDKSGDGKVCTAEMKSAVIAMNPSLKDEDVHAAMMLFDKNGSGDMTKQEFVNGIEQMKTFAN